MCEISTGPLKPIGPLGTTPGPPPDDAAAFGADADPFGDEPVAGARPGAALPGAGLADADRFADGKLALGAAAPPGTAAARGGGSGSGGRGGPTSSPAITGKRGAESSLAGPSIKGAIISDAAREGCAECGVLIGSGGSAAAIFGRSVLAELPAKSPADSSESP